VAQRRGIYAGERDAREHYPVQPGDWWRVGPHTFLCGDAEAGDAERVAAAHPPGAIWTDPPWSAGQAGMYRTIAGAGREVEFRVLIGRLAKTWSKCPGPVWAVCGLPTVDQVRDVLVRRGAEITGYWLLRAPPQCCLIQAVFADGPDLVPAIPRDTTFEQTAALCLATLPAGTVVSDYCCGLGAAPVAAAQAGLTFAGMELSPGRMARALQRTSEVTGDQPHRVTPA
jgi:hypothetical protein